MKCKYCAADANYHVNGEWVCKRGKHRKAKECKIHRISQLKNEDLWVCDACGKVYEEQ